MAAASLNALGLNALGMGQSAWATPVPYKTIAKTPTRKVTPQPVAVAPQDSSPHWNSTQSGMQVETQTSPVKVRVLNLPKGRSAVIDLPVDASDVFVSNPAVADAVLRTPRRIFVLGVGAGQSDAIFFDGMGHQILNLSIRVDAPTDELSDTVHRLFPNSKVEVQSLNGHVILSGMAQSDAQADQILRLAQTFGTKPEDVVNVMSIAGKDQVTLKVRVVEVNRTTIKQLGFDTKLVMGQLGGTQYSIGHSPTYGVNNKLLGGVTGGYSADTTTQPVSGYPITNMFTGLSQGGGNLLSALSAVGLSTTSLPTAVSSYLTGTGTSLTSVQSSFVSNWLNGLVATTSTSVTTADGSQTYTVTAPSAGISQSNLQALTSAYLAGGSANGTTLTPDQTAWMNTFYKNLPSYNNAASYSVGAGQDSTLIDKTNPANVLQTGRAGSTGVNSADAMIQAFERVGLVRTLAEPNLTTSSGEAAKFLAGGEFPVPIGEDNQGRVTVEWKPFGVGLGFTPVVLSSGLISIRISTEVSELSDVGALQLNSTLTIPGLSVRRAEDTVEMQSGSSLMIAGLLQSKYKQTVDSLPGLTTLPVLGTLFRSRDFLNDETEMVVIVTPYIVSPTSPDKMQTPADNLQIPDDLDTVFMGKLNKVIKAKNGDTTPATAPAGQASTPYQAPVGYVIE